MSLMCTESMLDITEKNVNIDIYFGVHSIVDRILVQDSRVMKNMLATEKTKKIDYCSNLQKEIKPHMRKIVVDWMLEVCEDQQCQPNVFHLAVSYLDRYLSRRKIKKFHFQLIATVCLFVSSKISEVVPMTAERLISYTDNSISFQEMIEGELVLLQTLSWELQPPTPLSFLEFFFHTDLVSSAPLFAKLRRHANLIAIITASEYQFLAVQPSILAAAALLSAVRGLSTSIPGIAACLAKLVNRPESDINLVVTAIEQLLASQRAMQKRFDQHEEKSLQGENFLVQESLSPIVA